VSSGRESYLSIAGLLAFVILAMLVIMYFPSVIGLGIRGPVASSFEQQPGFIWDYRGIDVLVQGFIVLAATVSIAAIFRKETKLGSAERTVEEMSPAMVAAESDEGEDAI